MANQIVLIDYENLQPAVDWARLARSELLVRIFLGPNQKTTPVEMSEALQPLGARVRYVRCVHAGKNALDFLLAFHLGRLAKEHPNASFAILSKDSGFDSLVKNLTESGINCRRAATLREWFDSSEHGDDPHLAKVIEHLTKLKKARPAKGTTLRTTIQNLTKATEEVVEEIIETLKARGIVVEVDGKVTYGGS